MPRRSHTHHQGLPPVAFEPVPAGEDANLVLLVVAKPVVAGHPGVVLVDIAEALAQLRELAGADVDPGREATNANVRLVAPAVDEIDDDATGIVGEPAAGELSPKLFLAGRALP